MFIILAIIFSNLKAKTLDSHLKSVFKFLVGLYEEHSSSVFLYYVKDY